MCRLCVYALQCVAVCGSVWQSGNACHCVLLCATVGCVCVHFIVCKCEIACGSVAMCVTGFHCVSLCATVGCVCAHFIVWKCEVACGSVAMCVLQCVAVCITVYHCEPQSNTKQHTKQSLCATATHCNKHCVLLLCITVYHCVPR